MTPLPEQSGGEERFVLPPPPPRNCPAVVVAYLPLLLLMEAGQKLAEIVDDYRPRGEPECEEAQALREWDRAVGQIQSNGERRAWWKG